MELLKDLYVVKSGIVVGKELDHCLNCSYCRANNNERLDYTQYLPSDINPLFSKLPVMINLFYGDPFIQTQNTLDILQRLENAHHTGCVIIITKMNMKSRTSSEIKLLEHFNTTLDLHFGISTFGIDSPLDGGSINTMVQNLAFCQEHGFHSSIEFRPIIYGINDQNNVFEKVIKYAKYFNVPIGYCGLQISEQMDQRLKAEGIHFNPYPGTKFGLKKHISKERDKMFRNMAHEQGVLVYRKSSCIFSMQNKMRDYNAHYYRANEVGCSDCPNQMICHYTKGKNDVITQEKIEELKKIIPFDFELVYKDKHICSLYQSGLCQFPTDDCKNLSGAFIKINEDITTSDVRIIKWLTGYTVDAKFSEIPYISTKWKK